MIDNDFEKNPLLRVPSELWDAIKHISHYIYPDDPNYGIDYLTRMLEGPLAAYGEREFNDGISDGTIEAFDFLAGNGAGEDSDPDIQELSPLPEEFWNDDEVDE